MGKTKVSTNITQEMRQKIDDGVWPSGMQIPSEPLLAKEFGVSRATVREAMQALVFGGLINKVRGVGSFVGHKTISYGMNELVSISVLIQQNGYKSSICHAALDVARPQPKHCQALGLSALEPVYMVQRVFAADDKPVVYEEAVFPCKLLPDVTEEDFFGSSFKMLQARDIVVKSADGGVRPLRATGEMAGLLEIAEGSPLLLMETVMADQNGQKIGYVKDHFTEWFEFPIRRVRNI
ncbi:GntR family transcriptional regulator [Clostridia bacterium OttesenSCG-928-O13]|nr:GntR family transcriptional regulator [Clostridia bacterium OttesenSCG-928-O13]